MCAPSLRLLLLFPPFCFPFFISLFSFSTITEAKETTGKTRGGGGGAMTKRSDVPGNRYDVRYDVEGDVRSVARLVARSAIGWASYSHHIGVRLVSKLYRYHFGTIWGVMLMLLICYHLLIWYHRGTVSYSCYTGAKWAFHVSRSPRWTGGLSSSLLRSIASVRIPTMDFFLRKN